jgi:hypothetical protein
MNNSLRSDLAKICEQHFPIATVKAELAGDVPKSKLMETIINHEVNKVINQVVDEILNLIASKMPEEKKQTIENRFIQDNIQAIRIEGYNSAITEVKSILKGGTE